MKTPAPTEVKASALEQRHSNVVSGHSSERKPPVITGQCAEVYNLISQHQPLLSFVITAEHAIPEAAARVHNLRAKGFNILTTILPEVEFRGSIRRNAALYSLGSPEWPAPGFFENAEVSE